MAHEQKRFKRGPGDRNDKPGYQPEEGDRDPSVTDYPEDDKITGDDAESNDPGDDDVGEDEDEDE